MRFRSVKFYSWLLLLIFVVSGASAITFISRPVPPPEKKTAVSPAKKKKKKKKKKPVAKKPSPVNGAAAADYKKKHDIQIGDSVIRPDLTGMKFDSWADSVFASLTPDERLAQLFMVTAFSNRDRRHADDILGLVKNYGIGGIMFLQGGPVRQAKLTNEYQAAARVPLMVSIDAEWGLAMRLDSTLKYPRQMALGAISNDSLIYTMGEQIAEQCRRIGIHVNFAPVVDVNNNPDNPVIGFRSFGEDKYNVARKGLMYMKGLQHNHVIANAKHFPGHGDTDADSHHSLPVINHGRNRIDSLELYPFRYLIENGLKSLMVAHLYIPAFDTSKNTATTLSPKVVQGLLKDTLKYRGLVFTDALNMKGVSAFYKPGEVDLKALIAGNDVLLCAEDVPKAIQVIKNAIDSGLISQEQVDERCMKILRAKEWVGLNRYKPVEIAGIYEDLQKPEYKLLIRKLVEESLTLVANKNNILPLKRLDTLKIASLVIGDKENCRFQQTLSNYAPIDHFNVKNDPSLSEFDSLVKKLSSYNLVVVSVMGSVKPTKNFMFSQTAMNLIDSVSKRSRIVLNMLASPYALARYKNVNKMSAVIAGYEDSEEIQDLSAQLIFGGIGAKGILPVSVLGTYPIRTGLFTDGGVRFKYTMPEELGIASADLERISAIAKDAIEKHATPGCQILVAKNGKVFYNKSFGHHTYEKQKPVSGSDIYDLASITKITASLPAVMKLYDEKELNLDGELCLYLKEVDCTNKQDLTLRDILTHQSGLKSWIPFYQSTLSRSGDYQPEIYSKDSSATYSYRVASGLYIHKGYTDSIMNRIIHSPLNNRKSYLYSDMGYYFLKQIVEEKSGTSFRTYLDQNFYKRLGLSTMGFKPRERFPLTRIVPTENDKTYRKQLLHGDVHDQGAAMLGGVGGHAGLFSNANDLAVMMQMYLNKGEYGGERYLSEETVNEFTRCQYCKEGNRRGLGFDKPEPDPKKESPCARCLPLSSFGHSGFTGTFTWADPESDIVYVFLSNRVHPDAENKKLITMGVRTKIQDVLYEVIKGNNLSSQKFE